jgi:hypothetical protein
MPGAAVMTSRGTVITILAASVATGLVAMLASSADAATKGATKGKRATHFAPTASATSSCRGANLFACGPIYNSTDYLGNDPDPFIRAMIQRDLGAKYGGEN